VFKNGSGVGVNDPIPKHFFSTLPKSTYILGIVSTWHKKTMWVGFTFFNFFKFYILISNLVKLRTNSGLTMIWPSLKHENGKLSLDPSYLLRNEAIPQFLFNFMIQSSNPKP
jgi:hypothetical protein